MGNAAGIDDNQVGLLFRGVLQIQAEPFKQLANLLTFVLVDFAAKSIYGKSFHNVL